MPREIRMVPSTHRDSRVRAYRRGLDIGIAGSMLLLLYPLIVATAVLVVVSLGRPVLYRQLRLGRHGQPFRLIKFRTMKDTRDGQGLLLPDEVRLSRVGRLLRRTSLDELPELINVLRGEMSLVGPRPLPITYLPRFTPEESRRLEVPPGLTGWAQVNGRNAVDWDERLRMDVWYVDNRSLALDLRIMAKTVLVAVRGVGVNQEGSATMTEFRPELGNPGPT